MDQSSNFFNTIEVEDKITRLNNILNAFRQIHKLIVQEKNLSKLIDSFCKELVVSGCYTSTWIVLLDKNNTPSKWAQYGFSDEFSILLKQFRNKKFNACSSKALLTQNVIQIVDTEAFCKSCPLFGKQPNNQAFTIRIEYKKQIFGLLSVEIPKKIALAEEETELFTEISRDLGLALHTILMEKEAEEHQIFLKTMSDAAIFFLEESNPKKIFDYIAKQLLTLTANNAYVIVAAVNNTETSIKVQSISGINNLLKRVVDILGENLIGLDIPIILPPSCPLKTGKLHKFEGGLYELFQGSRSKFICSTLTKLGRVGNIYQIGLTKNNHLFGNITFLYKGNNVTDPNPTTTEAFAKQASIAIHKNRTEKELLKSEKKFRLLAENSTDCIWTMNEDFEFTYTSPSVIQLLGYFPSEIEGTNFSKYFNETEFALMNLGILKSLKDSPNKISSKQTKMLRKDGKSVYVEIGYRAILGKNNKIIGLQGVTRDITERMETAKELQKMDKLQSVGLLAGGIAHDFNNILTGVYGNISLAMNTLPEATSEYKYLKEANNSMNRAILLTKQLLTFAKGGEPIKENVRITSLIKDVVKFDLSGSNILPIFKQAKDLWTTDADKGQIQQVFSNLTVNARHAMPEGGRVFIGLSNEVITHHTVLKKGNYIKITFKDEGTGIEPNNLDRVFEPYFSTKNDGSGLGLSTVYSIIAKHNGFVYVSSEKNQGTLFTIFLPAATTNNKKQSQENKTVAECIKTGKCRILVMDDEEIICQLLTEVLTVLGYESDFANEGNETIRKYKESLHTNNPYELIIMDLTIPGGKGGLETVKEILEIDPNAKVIVSSGYGHGKIMSNYREYGFIDIAPKPYTIDKLEEILQRVLNPQ